MHTSTYIHTYSYKCAYAMREHCLRSNNKISKVFGGSTVSSDEMKVSLDLYENSISLAGGESDRSNSGGGSGSNGYVNIVWAVDFNAALRERQLLRAAEASMHPTIVVGESPSVCMPYCRSCWRRI